MQLGYKQAKYIMRIELVDSFAGLREGNGATGKIEATSGAPASREMRVMHATAVNGNVHFLPALARRSW